MNNLIIENNLPDFILKKGYPFNIPLDNPQTIIGENYNFEIFLLENLKEVLIPDQYEAIVVSLNLNSNNSIDLNGLDVAYTLRLSSNLRHQFVPIIILGFLSLEIVLRINTKSNILLTPGVYYINLSTAGDECIDNRIFKNISKEDHAEFLERIKIKPPSNYQSNHSIANEWGILQWAEVLKISQDPALNAIKQKVEDLLFYKYLKCKYPPNSEFDNADFRIDGKRTILYIDDEWEKGWDFVLEKFFEVSKGMKFKTLKKEFKSQSKEKIIKECETEISNSNPLPDIILLDLRLCDSDVSSKPIELTGFKILQKIKGYFNEDDYFVHGINPGIQVIIFTASNKVWNLTELLAAGADGFVLKASPELSVNSSYTKDSFKSFVAQLKICVSRSFLKPFYESIKTIKKEIKRSLWHHKHTADQQHAITTFEGFTISMMEASFDILRNINSDNKKSKLRQAFLFLYQILEEYVKLSNVYIPSEKKSPGKVIRKDLSEVIVYESDEKMYGNTKCSIFFKEDKYDYQTSTSKKTPTSVIFKKDTYKNVNESGLFKIISVFKERHEYSELKCKKLIELTYLRSNLCGHVTGNINITIRDINEVDIIELISEIEQVLK